MVSTSSKTYFLTETGETTTVVRRTPFEFSVNFQGLTGYSFPVTSALMRPIPEADACFSVELDVPKVANKTHTRQESAPWLTVSLVNHKTPVRLSFRIKVSDKTYHSESAQSSIISFDVDGDRSKYGYTKLYQLRPSLLSLPDVSLDFMKVTISGIILSDVEHIESRVMECAGVSTVLDDLKRLLIEEDHGRDVRLVFPSAGDGLQKDLHAHSFMLRLRSPVFRAMLTEGSFQESITKEINIEDVTRDCFEEILRFIYTDSCCMESNTFGLLHASCKYGILSLEKAIETFLLQSMDISNVAEILYHAELFSAASLKKRAIEYISCNKECINLEGFFETINNPQLLIEILAALAKSIKPVAVNQSPGKEKSISGGRRNTEASVSWVVNNI